ncbi:MAG TPA: FRG domain-containing protein [Gemmatimonadaceae bacterium]|nr:FRG domain-containing protein [Gemmatimonadaceae bacterium]
MTIRESVVRTLGEFVDLVTPREPDAQTGRRRDTGVYRGASDAVRPLLTSLDRLGPGPHSKGDLEEHILRNFIRYSRPHLDQARPHDEWELLIAAQHHGVPTRLLDWTYSPLVAAFFATRPSPAGDADRVVWRLDWQRMHRHFGLPPLALLVDDLDKAFGEGQHSSPFKLFSSKARPVACMIEPPSLDSRIVAQAATFTFMSARDRPFDRFLEEQGLEDALTRYVIPADEVPRFRDQLDLVGIDERRLFPDLDGVAAAIQRYYA